MTELSADVKALLESVGAGTIADEKLPVAARLRAEKAAREAKARQEKERQIDEFLNGCGNPRAWIGQHIRNEGIFLGRYEMKDRDGFRLGKTFNVFAAPADLPKPMTYGRTVQYIAKLRNWHGHDGANYGSCQTFLEALETGRYNGGWIVPPMAAADLIFSCKEKGFFKEAFKKQAGKRRLKMRKTAEGTVYEAPYLYWMLGAGKNDMVAGKACFAGSKGVGQSDLKGMYLYSTRPVRLVEVRP